MKNGISYLTCTYKRSWHRNSTKMKIFIWKLVACNSSFQGIHSSEFGEQRTWCGFAISLNSIWVWSRWFRQVLVLLSIQKKSEKFCWKRGTGCNNCKGLERRVAIDIPILAIKAPILKAFRWVLPLQDNNNKPHKRRFFENRSFSSSSFSSHTKN